MDILKEWKSKTDGYYRLEPDNELVSWHVDNKADGWFWYTMVHLNTVQRSSSYFGPFNSWMAAAADCETAHKQDRRG